MVLLNANNEYPPYYHINEQENPSNPYGYNNQQHQQQHGIASAYPNPQSHVVAVPVALPISSPPQLQYEQQQQIQQQYVAPYHNQTMNMNYPNNDVGLNPNYAPNYMPSAPTPTNGTLSISVNTVPPAFTVPELSSAELRQHLLVPLQAPAASQPFSPNHPEYTEYSKGALLSTPKAEYRDKWFALLYVLHLIAYSVAGIYLFTLEYGSLNDNSLNISSNSLSIIAIGIGLSIFIALFALYLCKRYPRFLIVTSLIFSVLLYIALLIYFIVYELWLGVIIFGILFVIQLFWISFIRKRIPFAVAMLKQASDIISHWPATVMIAFMSIIVEVVLIGIWTISSVGLFSAANSNCTGDQLISTRAYAALFTIFLSFYWTTQVVKNVVHCTVSGLTSYWYFLYPSQTSPNPTLQSLKRATTTSFGSICLGSLFIAIIRALRVMARIFGGSSGSGGAGIARLVCFCIARIILAILDWIVTYINAYAFVQVSIYGKTYFTAAKDTWDLLQRRGLDAIINDSLIGSLLGFASFMGGLTTGIVMALFTYYVEKESLWWVWGIAGGFVGFSITLIALEVLDSAIITLFVCLAEDPTALFATKPEAYQKLVDALVLGFPKGNTPPKKKKTNKNQRQRIRNANFNSSQAQPLTSAQYQPSA